MSTIPDEYSPSESSRVVHLPWSVVSLYIGSPYAGDIPTIPVLYSPKALEKAKDTHHVASSMQSPQSGSNPREKTPE